ncbi:transposase [Streptomyces zaomyceticus]|uniref:transposase n=1 Tax=Streptomyces zaomyceticus TaxID=68286 RepID=UPI003420686D
MNIRLSRCTVLSQLMRVSLPPLVTPRVLGVDDFALYGDTYGTLLVDATIRLPLTLWEGRDAEQLSLWLLKHPGVEVACRDGSLTYRQGITGGAPGAVQVSDRFHLWQGLSRRVQDIASAHRGCLSAALPPAGEKGPAPAAAAAGNTAEDSRAARHARRLFEAVQALTRSGRSHSSVARELGLDCRTVGKYARARTWQEVMRRPPRKPSTLDPYLDYLQQRWDEGQREDPARGAPDQGLPRPLPAREDGHRTPPTGPAPGRTTPATALSTRSRPLDHYPPTPTQPPHQRPPTPAPRPLP